MMPLQAAGIKDSLIFCISSTEAKAFTRAHVAWTLAKLKPMQHHLGLAQSTTHRSSRR